MEYRVQWTANGQSLSREWGKANGANEEEAAVEYLKKVFDIVKHLSIVWIFVALPAPNHNNGMPMIVHGFKMSWDGKEWM